MAQVSSPILTQIDDLLDRLEARWREMPGVAAEIDCWDLLEQLDFTENWALEDMRLVQLETYVAQGALTKQQQARYRQLLNTIGEYRPLLEGIMKGEPA